MHVGPPWQSGPVSTPRFQERLLPGPVAWVLVGALVLSLAVAYGAAFSTGIGFLIGIVAGGIGLALIIVTSPVIIVDEESLKVGRARLPRWAMAGIAALDEAETNAARDRDARAFLALRPLTSKKSVLIELADSDDPHPYWLVTSRRPAALTASLSERHQEDR